MPQPTIAVFLIFASVLATEAMAGFTNACDRAAQRAAQSEDVPINVLKAISRVETGRRHKGRIEPWPWTINVEGQGYWFATEREAKSYVFNIFKAGRRSFDIGCFQINYRWHGKAFRSIDAMFDPDENARYAAGFLRKLHAELGSWQAAAGAYHSRTPDLAHAYQERFQAVLADLGEPNQDRPVNPFASANGPLIPRAHGDERPGVLGSLMPASDADVAFIAFN
ncbi:tail length tape measure protein [Ruegeria sp. ANG-S4]|nr:tail length tape measure protein [Ruegeria sp. ANG-S4]